MEAIILLGAPGAGKGTLAEGLRASTPWVHVSTGDMLRAAVKAGRPLGLQAKAYMDKGELVPDSLILQIVEERMQQDGHRAKYMFDGFPRTTAQAEALDALLARHHTRVRAAFQLDVPRALLIVRLSGRRVCRKCGAVYHIVNIKPRREGVCDQCGGELYQRPDDNEATVANRLDVYEEKTAGLIDYYQKTGALVRVDAVDRILTERFIREHLGEAT